MDASFIGKIADITQTAMANEELQKHGLAIVPSGYKVEDLSPYMKEPRFYKARFKTHLIDAFTNYCIEAVNAVGHLMDEEFNCYVQAWHGATDTISAQITFDKGTPARPGHGHNTASLSLRRTPLFDAVLKIEGQILTQDDLIEFLEDWHPELSGTRNDEEVPISQVITAIRRFKTKITGEKEEVKEHLKASQSKFAELDASDNPLPSHIVATGVAYDGLEPVDMAMRLSVNLKTDHPTTFKLRMTRRDKFQAELERDFVEQLSTGFTEPEHYSINLVIGSLD